jgi:hypothetical protein
MKSKALIALAVLSLSASSFAATTGTLLLKGQVGQVLSILVTPEAIASTLPLDISQVDTKVATVNEISNSSTGYRVSISSANLGNLLRTGGTETFAYTMKYNGSSVDLASGDSFSSNTAASVNVNKDVQISYTGVPAANMVAGEYEDTVTFEIAAN